MTPERRENWLKISRLGPHLQVTRERRFDHRCDRAHDVDQSRVDFSGWDDFEGIGAFAKRGIGNGLQASVFDVVAVFTVELLHRGPPSVPHLPGGARLRAAEERLLAGAIATDSADALHERGVRFHETIVGASRNPFFLATIQRINRVRRLLSYRSMLDRTRYPQHCREHLKILDLIERERNEEAAAALRCHLEGTMRNLRKIKALLDAKENGAVAE